MDARSARPKVVVIVGATACGKTKLAIDIAKAFDGEVISADSLTIYKNMDIGTAKPTMHERSGVPHWGFDLVGPGQRYTAAQFKKYAESRIADIQKRGKLPIVAGGTGLYTDALVFNFEFGGDVNQQQRQDLEANSTEQLQAIIKQKGYPMPENSQNRRYLIRTIERQGQTGSRRQITDDILLVGIQPDSQKTRDKINLRVDKMFDDGLVQETEDLVKQYGSASLLAKAKVAYGPVVDYLAGQLDLDQARERLKIVHWQFARRQRTWFKRNPHINWFENAADAEKFIRGKLTQK